MLDSGPPISLFLNASCDILLHNMARYRRFLLLLPVVFLLACISGTSAWSADRKIAISLGVLPVTDTLPLIVGVEKGFFAEQGLAINLIEFSGALERDVALQSGRIDAYFGDLLNTLLLIDSGQRLSLVTTVLRTDPRQRMFALLASPKSGLTDVLQIEEEQVALSRASVAEYVLDRIMAQASVRQEKVKKIEVRAIPIRYQMLMGDQIKLAVLPEPLAVKAESEGAKGWPTTECSIHPYRRGLQDRAFAGPSGSFRPLPCRLWQGCSGHQCKP